MSLVELIAVFVIGVLVGAYGCWLGREYIEFGILLLKRKDTQEETKPSCEQATDATQPSEANTTLNPTLE